MRYGRSSADPILNWWVCTPPVRTRSVATGDLDALIALKPDCVVYTALGETRPVEDIPPTELIRGLMW
ncbi:Uncharacterised protein [Mycolicibacterium vanbaalenii]|uniref:Fe/B12 periplasmic-binding domain-containing protein n=1 Tax=Mycolicibacterium vanbaalenii TaxID=110539 RepID=A0A5S9QB91_MYCVN|nr:Uncharacterised protein [Mycolicibacterium vanbaalenii]